MARNDCTIRALAAVTGISIPVIVGRLSQDGYRPGRGFHLDRWLTCQMGPAIGEPEYVFGWRAEWVALPKVQRGQKRITAAGFLRAQPAGRFILRQSRHVVAAVDGAIVME